MNDVIDRKPDWLDYYRDTIDGLTLSKEVAEKVRERETALAVGAKAESDFMSALWNGDVAGARKAIIEVLNTVAVVDPKLAGWYSVWLGMTYEIEGDDDNANVHYTRARSRLTQRLNLPFRAVFESGAFKAQAQNDFHHKLLSVCNQGPQALADLVAKLRAEIDQLARQDLSSNQHEESLRRVGERLGFNASRPDNDVNAGPDVVWSDEKTKTLIGFELKTKKEAGSEYSKADIGQCHNHIEWLRENFDGFTFDGLLVVGPEAPCSNQSNPSADMWLATVSQLQNCIGRLCARIDDVRGGTTIACWTALNEMGQLAEWQLPGIQAQMRTKRLVDLKG
ncbi:hypothetical protein N7E02_08200 [Aliirhizobium terrae]|uniref:hypothetical protein n=1 Tax=Terrirhizobium terrae TaxID=2926709 RepID=UPI002578E3FC|nr:hypothetical protein [Rhizobium sp. CC-CFT758]WJH40586.1 hypothetical protein N7E02_08200 [Rhizobium sp. CC-CFT758]